MSTDERLRAAADCAADPRVASIVRELRKLDPGGLWAVFYEVVRAIKSGRCAYPGCSEPAREFACGREHYDDETMERVPGSPAAGYCVEHTRLVSDEGDPEYIVACPACTCEIGVN